MVQPHPPAPLIPQLRMLAGHLQGVVTLVRWILFKNTITVVMVTGVINIIYNIRSVNVTYYY